MDTAQQKRSINLSFATLLGFRPRSNFPTYGAKAQVDRPGTPSGQSWDLGFDQQFVGSTARMHRRAVRDVAG